MRPNLLRLRTDLAEEIFLRIHLRPDLQRGVAGLPEGGFQFSGLLNRSGSHVSARGVEAVNLG